MYKLIISIRVTRTVKKYKFTSECGREIPNFHGRSAAKLAEHHFEQVKRLSHHEQNNDVRYQESASAVLVSRERKSPDVTETDRHCDAGQ